MYLKKRKLYSDKTKLVQVVRFGPESKFLSKLQKQSPRGVLQKRCS